MWRLLVIAVALCATNAQPGGGGPFEALSANLSALWSHVHDMEDGGSCRPEIVMHVHQGMGKPRGMGRRHHSGEHDDDEHDEGHDEDHDEGHDGDHHGPPRIHDGAAHVHVHLHMGMGGGRDLYHANPIPGAHMIPVEYVHAQCHIHSEDGVSGTIHMRQRFMGHDPVEMDFALSGFDHSAHEHSFFVHRYGIRDNQCSDLGSIFTPPHRIGGHRGRGPHSSSEEEEEPMVLSRRRRDHHGDHHSERDPEGEMGTLECDENGELHGLHEFDTVTIIGFHSIIGRSIGIHAAGDDGTGEAMACCTVAWDDGDHFGDENVPWLPGEQEDE